MGNEIVGTLNPRIIQIQRFSDKKKLSNHLLGFAQVSKKKIFWFNKYRNGRKKDWKHRSVNLFKLFWCSNFCLQENFVQSVVKEPDLILLEEVYLLF